MCSGTVFFDLVYSGLPARPDRGRRSRRTPRYFARRSGQHRSGASSPGARCRAVGRVRRRTPSASTCGPALARTRGSTLGIPCNRRDWTTPVTTSIAYERERSLITYEAPPARGRGGPSYLMGTGQTPSWCHWPTSSAQVLARPAPFYSRRLRRRRVGRRTSSARPGWRTSWPASTCSCPMRQKLEQAPAPTTSNKLPPSWRRALASSSSRMGVPGPSLSTR